MSREPSDVPVERVLDASALLAHLHLEPGAEAVELRDAADHGFGAIGPPGPGSASSCPGEAVGPQAGHERPVSIVSMAVRAWTSCSAHASSQQGDSWLIVFRSRRARFLAPRCWRQGSKRAMSPPTERTTSSGARAMNDDRRARQSTLFT